MNTVRKIRRIPCFLMVFLLFALCSPRVHAAEKETAEEIPLAPYFIIQGKENDPSLPDNFPLKSTHVSANINGMIAETYVTQTYTNEGDTAINARYVFPTSSGVTVHGMKMEIGNQIITAQVKEKEEARETYETAKSQGKSASLLEQKRPNVFTMDVANILPGDTVRIELHYTELITVEEGIYTFVFPTVVGPRYAAPQAEKDATDKADPGQANDWVHSPYLPDGNTPPGSYEIDVHLSTGVPIAELSSKSHQIQVTQNGDSDVRVTLAHPEDYAGNRDFILKYKLAGESVQSGLVLTSGQARGTGLPENFFMLTIQPPERFDTENIPPREYIFALDISGSMYGYPLDTARELIQDLVLNLRESDTFNLILFADNTDLLSPVSLPANRKNVQEAIDLIDKLDGGGGTSLLPAIQEATAIPKQDNTARSIVIITDGYVTNESDILSYIDDHMDTASFFSFGIGSSVNDYLIKQIAGCGLGEAFVVTDAADAADAAKRFRTYIASPLLTDISISYHGFDVYDVEPAVPSILYASRPIVLFGKWRGNPGGTIQVSGTSNGQTYTQEIPVEHVTVDMENESIRYLWARTRLDRVAGYGSVRNDASTREEITRLGLEYNMTTPYTSFVAVVETIRNTEGNATDVDQPLPLPQRVSNLAVGGGYSAFSEPDAMLLVLAVTGLVVVTALRNIQKKQNKERCHTCIH